jgi:hypothetical protein
MLSLRSDARSKITPDLRSHGHKVIYRYRADTFIEVSDLYLPFSFLVNGRFLINLKRC